MTTLAITINVSNPDNEDRRAMEEAIDQENAIRAAKTPPDPLLPKDTATNRRTSYEAILVARNVSAHQAAVRETRDKSLRDVRAAMETATPEKRDAAIAAALAALA